VAERPVQLFLPHDRDQIISPVLMMRTNRTLEFTALCAAFMLAITISSCTSHMKYVERYKFSEDYIWKAEDTIELVMDIRDNKAPYLFELTFRCASGFPYERMLLRVEEISPDNRSARRDVEILVRNPDGSLNGEKGFDIIDLTTTLTDKKEYPLHGAYHYRIYPAMGIEEVPLVMEVGLQLSRQE
jgi:gliding motility-associated lipoprotein GldH